MGIKKSTIEKEVEQTIDCFKKINRASVSPGFTIRVMQKLKKVRSDKKARNVSGSVDSAGN